LTVRSRAKNLIELYGFTGARRLAVNDPHLSAEIDRCELESFALTPSPTEQRQRPIQYPANHISKGVI